MELKKEHISIYLPFKLMINTEHGVRELLGITPSVRYESEPNNGRLVGLNTIKPLFRRLSQITKPITHNGETFIPAERLAAKGYEFVKLEKNKGYAYREIGKQKIGYLNLDIQKWAYFYFIQLVEWHFDVFSLHDQGLASVKK